LFVVRRYIGTDKCGLMLYGRLYFSHFVTRSQPRNMALCDNLLRCCYVVVTCIQFDIATCYVSYYFLLLRYSFIYRVIQEEAAILWEMMVCVILSKKDYINKGRVLNGYGVMTA
jgi:hypothetical protein